MKVEKDIEERPKLEEEKLLLLTSQAKFPLPCMQ